MMENVSGGWRKKAFVFGSVFQRKQPVQLNFTVDVFWLSEWGGGELIMASVANPQTRLDVSRDLIFRWVQRTR